MPFSPVHAVLVARPTANEHGLAHFQATIDAIRSQTQPVTALTVVLCGATPSFAAAAQASGAEGIVQADARTSFAHAVALANSRIADGATLWLLAQDTTPEPDALEQLAGRLDLSPSVAVAAPKLVRQDDPQVLVSLGVSMTRGGQSVDLAQGQIDQAQHDRREDVMGADVRGLLIRGTKRNQLLPDPALGGADEGLDIGIRARLATDRVITAPAARIHVAADGVAGLPEPERSAERRRIAYTTRLAQLHRRLTYAPAYLVPLHLLSFIPLLLWRAVLNLIDKLPGRVLPESGATIVAGTRWGAIARSRAALRGTRAQWWRVDSLRLTRAQVRMIRSDEGELERTIRPELRFFSGGAAWAVIASFLVSVLAFPVLLGWQVLGGGGALPLARSVQQLWADASWGARGYGLGEVGAADPFAAVLAVLGSLWPGLPGHALVLLWLLALPLATLGGWFAMTRFTERGGVRLAGAVVWTLAPWFVMSLVDPRPAAVIVHLLLPWLVYTALATHRSWGAAGASSLLLAAIIAAAPSLAILFVPAVVVAVVFAIAWRRLSSAVRLGWMLAPTVAMFAPLVWAQLRIGNPFGLLADPGTPYQGARAGESLLDKLAILAGFPDGSFGGAQTFLGALKIGDGTAATTWWVLLLPVLFVVVAVVSLFTKKWRVSSSLMVLAGAALVGALLSNQIAVAATNGQSVALWPGVWLSVAWLALVGAAAVAFEELRRFRRSSGLVVAVATLLFAVTAVPALTAIPRDVSVMQNGPRSTLPAFVAAEFAKGNQGASLVLTVLPDGAIAQRVVWGASDTLSAQSTLQTTRRAFTPEQLALAGQVANLVTPDSSAGDQLAEDGIRFVIVEPVREDNGVAAGVREQAVSALNQRAGIVGVGETGKGALWRVDAEPHKRAELTSHQQAISVLVGTGQIVVALVAVLLAIPTRLSVRAARTRPRVIGERREAE